MTLPRGLRKPRRVALLIPLVLAIAAEAFGFFHIAKAVMTSNAGEQATSASGAGTAPTLLQPELFWGIGVIVLGLAIAYGAWQYHTRNRANDKITEAATRESYKHPDLYAAERAEFQQQIKPS